MIADGKGGSSALDATAMETKKEIERALRASGAGRRVHVAIQMDFKTTPGTSRVIVGREKDWHDHSREEDAGDPLVLERFFKWIKKSCPARRYLVHFWGHSAGPVGLFFDDVSPEARPDALTLPELKRAFRTGKTVFKQPIDIVLFKDCWIGTLETAYQLRNTARYMIASQAQVPIKRWPYRQMFSALAREHESEAATRKLAEVLGDYYQLAKHRPHFDEIPYAAIDVDAVRAVDEPFKALTKRLVEVRTSFNDETRLAIRRSSCGDPALVDVLALCRNLSEVRDEQLRECADDVSRAVRFSLMVERPTQSIFQGVSTLYFPPYAEDRTERIGDSLIAVPFVMFGHSPQDYRDLDLSRKTKWHGVALENYSRAITPAAHAEGGLIVSNGESNKPDTFGINWTADGDTITFTIQRKKVAARKAKNGRKRSGKNKGAKKKR